MLRRYGECYGFIDLRGVGPLWAPATGGSGHVQTRAALTSAGGRVRATCEALKARLLVVDSLAGAYAGDENTRALVRAFCADWDAWASANRCAVMLIAHPPKAPSGGSAPSVDADYAGSTDWHNAARWRWALEPTPTGRTRTDKTGKDAIVVALALKLAKSSYGPDGARVFLASSESHWDGGESRWTRRRRMRLRRETSDSVAGKLMAKTQTGQDRSTERIRIVNRAAVERIDGESVLLIREALRTDTRAAFESASAALVSAGRVHDGQHLTYYVALLARLADVLSAGGTVVHYAVPADDEEWFSSYAKPGRKAEDVKAAAETVVGTASTIFAGSSAKRLRTVAWMLQVCRRSPSSPHGSRFRFATMLTRRGARGQREFCRSGCCRTRHDSRSSRFRIAATR